MNEMMYSASQRISHSTPFHRVVFKPYRTSMKDLTPIYYGKNWLISHHVAHVIANNQSKKVQKTDVIENNYHLTDECTLNFVLQAW